MLLDDGHVLEGWIFVKTQVWKKRHATLEGDTLSFFKSPGDLSPCWRLELSRYKFFYEGWSHKPPPGPRVRVVLNGELFLQLRFGSLQEVRRWLPTLKADDPSTLSGGTHLVEASSGSPTSWLLSNLLSAISWSGQEGEGDVIVRRKSCCRSLPADSLRIDVVYPEIDGRVENGLLMGPELAQAISKCLDAMFSFHSWYCIYTPRLHGLSINTLYREMERYSGSSVLLIRDTVGYVFGCFVSDPWQRSQRYFGSGTCLCFSFGHMTFEQDVRNGRQVPVSVPDLSYYNRSGKNEMFMFADDLLFGIGGGDSLALTVDADFLKGSSRPCSTFDNASLSSTVEFVIETIEFWGFMSSK